MDDAELRKAAVRRLEAKRGFHAHAIVYGLVNLLLVVVWASGAERGYFWPAWPIGGWGIALGLHWWAVYLQRPISEDEIRREMERSKASSR
jgi:hypothetical protein